MNKWELEPNPEIVRRLGKLGEELSELSAVCFRAIIQGVDQVDPSSRLTNRVRLSDELADVHCQLVRTVERLRLDERRIGERVKIKMEQMDLWEGMYSPKSDG